MSSERKVRILSAEYPRFPGYRGSALGKSGPKARQKCVVDVQQGEIPAPVMNRTVVTRKVRQSRE